MIFWINSNSLCVVFVLEKVMFFSFVSLIFFNISCKSISILLLLKKNALSKLANISLQIGISEVIIGIPNVAISHIITPWASSLVGINAARYLFNIVANSL